MTALQALFETGQAGLTVYTPDCTYSRLWGNLDHAIQAATGFQVVARRWIKHDINSILRFYTDPNDESPSEQDTEEAVKKYERVPPEILQAGHLVVRHLLMAASLVTIWQGDNAIETLLNLKGKTHPAEAEPNTIRSGFWCENAVCNLMHSSDNQAEAERELTAVNLSHVLDEQVKVLPLIHPRELPVSYVAHSGLSVLCDVLIRMGEPITIQLPPSGGARACNDYLVQCLQKVSSATELAEAYLAGDVVAVTNLMEGLPVTQWEHFVIQCGTLTRDKW